MIELQDLSKTFQSNGKAVKAVDSVSLTVNEGEICVFLGPSGCGKSTTLKTDQPADRADLGQGADQWRGHHRTG